MYIMIKNQGKGGLYDICGISNHNSFSPPSFCHVIKVDGDKKDYPHPGLMCWNKDLKKVVPNPNIKRSNSLEIKQFIRELKTETIADPVLKAVVEWIQMRV